MVGNQREADLRTLLIHEKETWENWREEKKKTHDMLLWF
jgi:hypothetical protein